MGATGITGRGQRPPKSGPDRKPIYDKTKAAGAGALAASPVVTIILYLIAERAPGLPTEVSLAIAVLVGSLVTAGSAFLSSYATKETKNRS